MNALILILGLLQIETVGGKLENGQYLSAVTILQKEAYRMQSPQAIRRYIVVLTELHSQQIAFRTFLFRNLQAGEHLHQLRNQGRDFKLSKDAAPVENNAEQLLLAAQKEFPESLDIEFAVAQFLVAGSCCYINPKLSMGQSQIHAIFEKTFNGNNSFNASWVFDNYLRYNATFHC